MRELKKIHLLLCLLLTILMAGCTVSKEDQEKERIFTDLYPGIVMNQKLSLQLVKVLEPPKINSRIFLEVENNSADTFQFPADFNVALWEYDQDARDWKSIPNWVEYYPKDQIILSPDPDQMKVIPIVSNGLDANKHLLRVVVYGGKVMDGNITDELEGAFIDITLQPEIQ